MRKNPTHPRPGGVGKMNLPLWLLDLLFPPRCPFCRQPLEQPRDPACPDCQTALPWLTGETPRRTVDFADGCFAPLSYLGPVPKAIHRYKFSRIRAYAAPFGTLMAQCAQDCLPIPADAVVWVPLSSARLRERGFDQAELLAREVAARLNLPVLHALAKVWDTPPQSTRKDSAARRANALGAYSLHPEIALTGQNLILVDDVVTSGATLSECARLLKQAGAHQVWCVTLVHAGSEPWI